MKEYQSLAHTRWDCKYHVVFIPKRRKKAIFGSLRRHLDVHYLSIQKQQRRLRLILRRSCHIALHGKMAQKTLHFIRAHVLRMTFVMEQQKPPRPVEVSLLGADAIVAHTNFCAHSVEQFGGILNSGLSFHLQNFRLP